MQDKYSISGLETIYHILTIKDWDSARKKGFYEPENFGHDKFIHFSFASQVLKTAKHWFSDHQDLLILEVEQARIQDHLMFEGSPELFPHLYKVLDLALVKRIAKFNPDDYRWRGHQVQKDSIQPLVLFDIDSTLLKGTKAHKEAFRRAFMETFGLAKGLDEVKVLHGRTDPDLVEEALSLEGIPIHLIRSQMLKVTDSVVRNYYSLYGEDLPQKLPGASDLLSFLKSQEIALGLVTGNLEPIGWAKLSQVSLDSYFTLGAFSSDSPDRVTLVRLAIEKHMKSSASVNHPGTIFMVGDALQDMEAASKNDIVGIGVCTGIYTPKELFGAGARFVVENLSELLERKDIFA